MDVNELFNFGKTKKLTLGAAMRNPTRVERTSSSESGSSDDEAGSTPPRRARRKRRASQRQSLASRLMQNKVIALDDSPSQEDDLRILDGTRFVPMRRQPPLIKLPFLPFISLHWFHLYYPWLHSWSDNQYCV